MNVFEFVIFIPSPFSRLLCLIADAPADDGPDGLTSNPSTVRCARQTDIQWRKTRVMIDQGNEAQKKDWTGFV